ncbi:hypothetical protein EV643_109183 [Kribbella sp. VKM Ac-2527]|uniref:WD40 repeat protein n=2 Tax=Kribbella caucasensis TaxID=2512215 RepID=A0A4V3C9U9_9ACTN|nr:hypothetical protein EV643_109183 [Kribbella sp. VKM Ac-2527]
MQSKQTARRLTARGTKTAARGNIMNPDHRARRMIRLLVLALALPALIVGTAATAQATAQHDSVAGQPATFVASRDGVVVLVSSTTGRVLRALTTPQPGGRDSDPYLADSGRTVVFVRGTGTCSSSILAVPRWGGRTRVLVPGTTGMFSQPRLSRDGRLLAYQRHDCAARPAGLMVRTLRTGATHTIAVPGNGEALSYTFTANGRRLITALYVGTYQVWSIPVRARSVAAGRLLHPAQAGCFARHLTAIGPSRYVAVDQYCPTTGEEKVLKVDNRTGRRVGVLALVPTSVVGLAGIDFDATGRHLLLQDQGSTVYTVTHGAKMAPIATGFQSATW